MEQTTIYVQSDLDLTEERTKINVSQDERETTGVNGNAITLPMVVMEISTDNLYVALDLHPQDARAVADALMSHAVAVVAPA